MSEGTSSDSFFSRDGLALLKKSKRVDDAVGGLAPTAALAAFMTMAAAVYWPVLSKLLSDWWTNPDYSHGLVMAPAAVWIGWRRLDPGRLASGNPNAGGMLVVLMALALLGIGTLGAELFVTRVSLLLFAAGTVVYLLGWAALRALTFPLSLLALTIPLPAIIGGQATLALQLAASRIAESALSILSVPVLRDGNVLMLPRATLQVAEACSGIRSLAALFTLSLIVARAADRRLMQRLAIIASTLPIAVLVNGLRVTATALAIEWWGLAAASGVVHETLGIGMFMLALGCLAGAARAVACGAGRAMS